MPHRTGVARELAEIFKILAHPDRIRIVEELRLAEADVRSLAARLDLTDTRISQHLALMRAHRLVEERRDGRHHLYHLTQPDIAGWVAQGLNFLEGRQHGVTPEVIARVREAWSARGR